VQYAGLGVGCVQLGVCGGAGVLVVALSGLWDRLYGGCSMDLVLCL
jgi:hypothetical protein